MVTNLSGGDNLKSLYIHIPFCQSKCYYCDFNSYCGKDDLIENYIDSVIMTISHLDEEYKTVYFGGGTPSFIPSKYIKKIMQGVNCHGEVTLELNPGTVTKEKLQDYKEAGINRLSIGLQATQNDLLKRIGRIHTFEEFEEAYNIARKVGFNNISVDIMFGLPGQTLKDVEETLNYIININPEHISCYSLIIHDELVEKHPDAFSSLPTDEEERRMYYLICDRLKEAGFMHYEISNFAKPGFESQHNLCYWNQEEYYGVGAGASGYVGGIRYKNFDNIEDYIVAETEAEKNSRHNNYQIVEEIQTPESKINEYMILKLRLTSGISVNEAKEKFKINILEKYSNQIEKLINQGLIEKVENEEDIYIRLTKKGLDLANIVWEEFI